MMLRFEICHDLDEKTLAAIRGLIEENVRVDGHSPVGEHKYAHLGVGAPDWTGVLAWDDDGALRGYVHTLWQPPGHHPRIRVEVVVHPDVRADGRVARDLVTEVRRVLAAEGGGTMWLWVHHVVDPGDTLAARMGFSVQRELAYMERKLDDRPEVPATPEGVRIAAHRPGADDAEFLRVNNAAFTDHPENGGWDADELDRRRSYEWFDPAGLLMAWRGERLLGFHWTKWHAHTVDDVPPHDPEGEVYILAVDPSAQGLGLGRTLLAAGLAHLWDVGCRLAVLYVDASSTAAVRLYERAGFVNIHSEVCFEQDVAAVAA